MEGGTIMCKGWVKLYRSFYEHEISIKPPHYREIFLYLVANANHKDNMCSGTLIQRGQLYTSFQTIRDALQWFNSNKKMKYTKRCVSCVMKYLRDRGMINTHKTTRGVIVTICNYDEYQSDSSTSVTPESQYSSSSVTPESQQGLTINKNEKNGKNGKNNTALQRGNIVRSIFKPPSLEETQSFFKMNESSVEAAEDFINFYESKGWLIGKTKMKNWQAAARGWIKRSNKPTQPNIPNSNYIKHDHDKF